MNFLHLAVAALLCLAPLAFGQNIIDTDGTVITEQQAHEQVSNRIQAGGDENLPEAFQPGYRGSTQCCSPDFIIIVDITDVIGFSRNNCESHIRQFLRELFRRASPKPCDEVRTALIEYGTNARIRWDFTRFKTRDDVKWGFDTYVSAGSLGGVSNAHTAFLAADILLSNVTRGRRPGSNTFIFWLVHSTPAKPDILQRFVNRRIRGEAYIITVAVGKNIDQNVVRPIARSSAYYFWVADILHLVHKCNEFYFNYCPIKPTTTQRTTTTTVTTRTPPRTLPTATTARTQPTTTTTTAAPTTRTTPRTAPTATTARTTTTQATTRLPDPTTPLPPADVCFQCRSRRNHKDLYPDATDCHFYYQCFYFNETYATGIRRPCAAGTFWHDEVLQCMPEGSVPCVDRCRTEGTGFYPGSGCRQFFVCANSASYGLCCPVNTRFNAATGSCDDDDTCVDACIQQGAAVATTVRPAQQLNATTCRDSFGSVISTVPGEANAYFQLDEEGHATDKMYCPPFVSFNLVTCRCDIESDVTVAPGPQKRIALLWVNFDTDTQDHSLHKWTTFAYDGAQRDASVAAYGGGSLDVNNGYIAIPGLKTYDMRNHGSWAAFFRCDGNAFQCLVSGGILSNNKDATASEYTVILATGQTANTFVGRLGFQDPVGNQVVNSQISNTPSNGWNHVAVTYDGNTIRLYLNGAIVDTVNVGGFFSIAHCPYVIGTDQFFGYFSGHIDDVLITPFAMTEAEITAHRTGDRAYLQAQGFW